MAKIGKILEGGLTGGLIGAGRAAGIGVGDIARHGGFGVMGMLAAKKKKRDETGEADEGMKRGGKAKAKKMAKGGSTASKRADGCAQRGKTRGRFV